MVGVSGHQGLPEQARDWIRDHIRSTLEPLAEPVGVTSLAVGADQLFADVVVELGGRLHVVVPSADYDSTFRVPEDLERFRHHLDRAMIVETLHYPAPTETAFLAAGQRIVDIVSLLVAVWDGRPAHGSGGTADIVSYAIRSGTPVEIVWPEGLQR